MKKHASIGSVSWGTMRPQDLIPRFLEVLEELDPKRAEELEQEVPEEAWEDDSHAFWGREDASYLLEELFDVLNDYAPPFCYFGAAEGDGADYGFWIDWIWLKDAVEDGDVLEVTGLDEVPDDYTGHVLEVNDHGNVTLWDFTEGGQVIEVWSVV